MCGFSLCCFSENTVNCGLESMPAGNSQGPCGYLVPAGVALVTPEEDSYCRNTPMACRQALTFCAPFSPSHLIFSFAHLLEPILLCLSNALLCLLVPPGLHSSSLSSYSLLYPAPHTLLASLNPAPTISFLPTAVPRPAASSTLLPSLCCPPTPHSRTRWFPNLQAS